LRIRARRTLQRFAGRILLVIASTCQACIGAAQSPLPSTDSLTETRPLDEVMVAGIDRLAVQALQQARRERPSQWSYDYSSPAAYKKSVQAGREELRNIVGAVDSRVAACGIEFLVTTVHRSNLLDGPGFTVDAVRWPVLEGVTAAGLFLQPRDKPIARVVAIPDADWTPEMIAGLGDCSTSFAADLAAAGCEVLVPTLINRDHQFSGNEEIGKATNLTHREFIYRQAFEVGRHVIGYEVQRVLAGVDQFELRNQDTDLPIAVIGAGEGGLLALYSTAIDPRIDGAAVSGYFDQREQVWAEPIYRNVWKLLHRHGDAEIAGLIAPRLLFIEIAPAIPPVAGPPAGDRNVAAPGTIKVPDPESVMIEIERAKQHWAAMRSWPPDSLAEIYHSPPDQRGHRPLSGDVISGFLSRLTGATVESASAAEAARTGAANPFADGRQQRQIDELVEFTQRVLRHSHRVREQKFAAVDRSSVDAWQRSVAPLRNQIYSQLIGKLPLPTIEPNPRSRQVLDDPSYIGYEVVLDVYPDVIAAGILLMPKNVPPDQRLPVVVCQHGLEGTPRDTIAGPESRAYGAYKAFAAELAKQGFIVYAPQNPYRGRDAFRTLQRKSNPLGRSLCSYIIRQHLVTLRWLASLPNVDSDRIGFYGLSYGGKTAMRVPPMLPPTETEPGYCLSICSADFNEWVAKNASVDVPFSYVWTGEYEIFEWNMAHIANYAELAMLVTPRPFMVERGHDDGVGLDEWVAWEYAKVRRHYNQLGIGERTEIEFFDGPHTINGKGTFHFLQRWLRAE